MRARAPRVSVNLPPPPRVEVTRESLPDPLNLREKDEAAKQGKQHVILGSIVDPVADAGEKSKGWGAPSDVKIKLEDLQGKGLCLS